MAAMFTAAASAWRFRNDDGTQATATWMAAQNTQPADIAVTTKFRLRFRAGDTGGASGSLTPRIRYSQNGGAYAEVTSSTPVQFADSTNIANGDATTTQLTGGSGGTFAAGQVREDNSHVAVSIGASGNTEAEWVLLFDSAQVTDGDTFTFRIYDSTSALSQVTATVGVDKAPAAPTLTATVAATTIDLSATDVGASTYEFQRDTVTIQNTASRTRNDTVTPGTSYTYRVRGIGAGGTAGAWSSEETRTANYAPTASITATPSSYSDPLTVIALDGTGSSDSDGTIASYLWELVSAPPGYTGTFSAPTGSTTNFTPSAVAFADDFTGTNGNAWDSAKWEDITTKDGSSTVTIQSNAGQMLGASSYGWTRARAITGGDVDDFDMLLKTTGSHATDEHYSKIVFRADTTAGNEGSPYNGYEVEITPTIISLIERVANAGTTLGSQTWTATTSQYYFRIRCVGSALKVRWWLVGNSEPSTWNIEVTDSTRLTGRISLAHVAGAGAAFTRTWDDVEVVLV